MTKVALADGTEVPLHYDFNQHFEPLVVKNQAPAGICWWETRCTMLEAFVRAYSDRAPTFDPHQLGHVDDGWAVSRWSDERFDPPHPIGTMTFVGGDVLTKLPGYAGLPEPDAIAKALWTNGVLEGTVFCEQSFDRLWSHPARYADDWNPARHRFARIPTLHCLPGDLTAIARNSWAHSVIYVGYRLVVEGGRVDAVEILVQNSWGGRFGKGGRCYLGEDLVRAGGARPGFIHAFDDHPAGGLVMPPLRSA